MGEIADDGIVLQGRLMHEEKPLVVIHPDVGQSCGIYPVGVLVVGEGVRVEIAEDVSNTGTRHLQETYTRQK